MDGRAMAGVSVESYHIVVLRSPRGRLGSVQDVGKRLRRMRAGFHRWIPMRTGAQLPTCLHHDPPKFGPGLGGTSGIDRFLGAHFLLGGAHFLLGGG